ncbi:pirin family protein [Methanolobus sp. WCC5]|uniref:pirin family protein n=1 Tax=Methanolobus sp. WCC5 TaxID=3125785 RepID=UPI003248BE90
MTVIKSDQRHLVENESQHSYWLLSYSDYLDMKNTHFGDIKVFNDEVLKAGKALKMESVSDKEIVIIVFDGELTLEDTTGTKELLKAGDVQVLSAGEGVCISGSNPGEKDAHFCRVWIEPLRKGMEPAFRQKHFVVDDGKKGLIPLASGQGFSDALKMRANGTVYLSRINKGEIVDLLTDLSRFVLIYMLEGELTVCGQKIEQFDQARLNQNETIVVQADSDALFILVDAASNS